jgi:hypothetical protein
MKSGTVLPSDVFRSEAPPKVRDSVAFQRLNNVLCKAASQLAALGSDPAAVAASPNRFDDASSYDWRAVRCGSFFSEKESYCRQHDLDRDLETASPVAKAAHMVLKELEAAGWRDLFATAFDIRWADQCLALVVQDRLSWLVFSANNISSYKEGDPVFAIWDDAEMSYFGEAEERFDWAIQQQIPLVFRSASDTPPEAGVSE